jgi:Mor family transcriptional regulator
MTKRLKELIGDELYARISEEKGGRRIFVSLRPSSYMGQKLRDASPEVRRAVWLEFASSPGVYIQKRRIAKISAEEQCRRREQLKEESSKGASLAELSSRYRMSVSNIALILTAAADERLKAQRLKDRQRAERDHYIVRQYNEGKESTLSLSARLKVSRATIYAAISKSNAQANQFDTKAADRG